MTIFDPQTLGRLSAQEAPKWATGGAQAHPSESQKCYKIEWILIICGLEASQCGTRQQGREEEQHKGA